MTVNRTLSLIAISGVLVLSCGCRRSLEANVHGTVTLDNAPLKTGAVTFHPVAKGTTAYGRIQPDGSYTLATGTGSGLNSGEYVVTVVATGPSTDPKDYPAKVLTPPRYQSADKSPFHVTVQSGRNKIDLALTSK